MSDNTKNKVCAIIGASQAGVTCAFALRDEGWQGEIILFDADPKLPYYRPPLSKAILTGAETLEHHSLMPADAYHKQNISLKLGVWIKSINRQNSELILANGNVQKYDKLVIATGARAFIPQVKGLNEADNVFVIRTAQDAADIRAALDKCTQKRAVLIGGGYIGLETAASLKKLGAGVTVIERSERVLARVTTSDMSNFFMDLHKKNGVNIVTNKTVVEIVQNDGFNEVICDDGSVYQADVIVFGVGIIVNKELAEQAGIEVENGIKVDATARTSDENIYAIGDCSYHHNPIYDRYIRLESVQNANDQAKVAAQAICGNNPVYSALPWFWSDQFDVKLQIVGLSQGHTEALVRNEGDGKFSVWYFNGDKLLAVDAVNDGKAYMMGTKIIKSGSKVDKAKLVDISVDFKPANILVK